MTHLTVGVQVCVVCLLAGGGAHAWAEQLSVRGYTTSDGLSNDGVRRLHQDAKGYLWIGTEDGLSRFDGYRFVNYDTRHGLGHVYINDLAEDAKGRLWIATNGGGVSRLLDDPREASSLKLEATRKFINFAVGDSAESNRVNAIVFDRENRLWCATDGGLYRTAGVGDDRLAFELIVPVRPGMHRMDALADSRGRVWFGLPDELVTFNRDQIIQHGLSTDSRLDRPVTAIAETPQRSLLVATERAVFELIESGGARGRLNRWPIVLGRVQGIYSMSFDAAGTLWIGTSRGLIKYRDGRQTVYTTAQGLSDDEILAVAPDRDGNLWLATGRGGLCRLIGENVVTFTRADGLPDGSVARVLEDRSGRIYATIWTGGLVEMTDAKAVPVPRSQRPTFNSVHGRILQDSRGDWWIGTETGVFRFDGPGLQLRHGTKLSDADGISSAPIAALVEDRTGKLWVSSTDGHLYWRDVRNEKSTFARVPHAAIAPFNFPLTMIGDASGALWLGEQGLLGRLRGATLTRLEPMDGLPETEPRAFFLDSRGWLWIGLRYGGVSMTRNPSAERPQFVNYSMETGLASNTVWSITEDDSGRMYFGTGRGLNRLDLTTGRIRHFTSIDGLAGDRIAHCLKDRRGNIWIATHNGVSRLNPRDEPAAPPAPAVFLNSVRIAGEEQPLSETGAQRVAGLVLPAARNNLSIEYVGLSLRGERTLQYQYMLEGVDSTWNPPTERRSVSYARLGSGPYRFVVRAINEDGVPGPEPAVLELRILPPLWLRWWFLSLAVGLVGVMVYALHRYRLTRALEIEQVRTRIAADLHDDIGASLSRIAIQSEVAKREIGGAHVASGRLLSNMADTARGLVDTMSDIVWSIDPTRDDLATVVFRAREFAGEILDGKHVRWEFNAPPDARAITLGPDHRRQLYLFLKEAVTNIARHSECTMASIDLATDGRVLTADIRDDGRGMPEREASDSNGERSGHGLSSMRARAAALGGRLDINSAPGMGTHLRLEVPLR